MIKYRICVLCVLMMSLSIAAVSAQPIVDSTAQKEVKTLRIGVPSIHQLPFWSGSAKLPAGLLSDYIRLMEIKMDFKTKFISFDSIIDIKHALDNNEIDFSIGYFINDDSFLYSQPIYQDSVVGWVAPELSHLPQSELDWACIDGSTLCDILYDSGLKVVKYDSYNDFTKKIRTGEILATIGLYQVYLHYFKKRIDSESRIVFNKNFPALKYQFQFNKSNAKLKALVDEFIVGLEDEESQYVLDFLESKYLVGDEFRRGINVDTKTLSYSFPEGVFPYSYLDESTGTYRGMIHDVFKELTAVTPLNFKFVPSKGRDVQQMLDDKEIDFIPLASSIGISKDDYEFTDSFFNVQFSFIETKQPYDTPIIAVLDRFGLYDKEKYQGFVIYTDADLLINDLTEGKITHAYLSSQLLDSIYLYDNDSFNLVPHYFYNTLDENTVMLLRKGDKETKRLVEESLKIISETELQEISNKYNKIEYKIGYRKENVNYIAFIVLVFIVTMITMIVFYRKSNIVLTEKMSGFDLINRLSEAQRDWLLNIINNFPHAVCISDRNCNVLLSNDKFNDIELENDFKNEGSLIRYIAKQSKDELQNDFTMDISLLDKQAVKNFTVVNKMFSHESAKGLFSMTVLTDITDLKQNEATLISLKQNAEEALESRKAFLAVISHELRTPISAVIGLMELLSDKITNTLHKEMLNNAFHSAKRLKSLVDEILHFSKLEAYQLTITYARTNFAVELSSLLKHFEVIATNKNLAFQVDWIASTHLVYTTDFLRISQVISNVISNSIKFTDSGLIYIKINLFADRITIMVKDTGIGMSETELARIYDPFVQAQNDVDRKYGGTGLGMSIVKSIVDLMQGEISVQSIPDGGTTTIISIPAISEECDAVNTNQVYTAYKNSHKHRWLQVLGVQNIVVEDSDLGARHPNFYPDCFFEESNNSVKTTPVFSGKVMVIDDDATNRFVLSMQLEEIGLSTITFGSASQAIKYLSSRHDIDVIMTDYHMPEMNGLDFSSKIRTVHKLKTPIILCTADNSEGLKEDSKFSFTDAILHKPYELKTLIEVINPYITEKLPNISSEAEQGKPRNNSTYNWIAKFDEKHRIKLAESAIVSLSSAVETMQQQPEKNRESLHRLKGTLGLLELDELQQLCEKIEENRGDADDLNLLIQQIDQLISEAQDYINHNR